MRLMGRAGYIFFLRRMRQFAVKFFTDIARIVIASPVLYFYVFLVVYDNNTEQMHV